MCGLHGFLVAATGALFMIPDLSATARPSPGSGARRPSLLQLTATPLVFAVSGAGVGASAARRRAGRSDAAPGQAPAMTGAPAAGAAEAPPPRSTRAPRRHLRPSRHRPSATAFVSPLRAAAGHSTSAPSATHTAASAPSTPTAVTRSVVSPLPAATRQPVANTVWCCDGRGESAPDAGRTQRGEAPSKRALDWEEPMIEFRSSDRGPAPGRDVRPRPEG
jgi:hypothetical protein